MTEEERRAMAVFEMRTNGMHPTWIKWFVFYGRGEHLSYFLRAGARYHQGYCVAPNDADVRVMRKHGFNPDTE